MLMWRAREWSSYASIHLSMALNRNPEQYVSVINRMMCAKLKRSMHVREQREEGREF
jgi:hypothetical protein